jgi:hypothetical protein
MESASVTPSPAELESYIQALVEQKLAALQAAQSSRISPVFAAPVVKISKPDTFNGFRDAAAVEI